MDFLHRRSLAIVGGSWRTAGKAGDKKRLQMQARVGLSDPHRGHGSTSLYG